MSGNSKRRLLDDVVDDSEPEREAKRQKTTEQARLVRKKKCAGLLPQKSDRLDQDAIELTDTECNPHDLISPTAGTQSQVDKSVIGITHDRHGYLNDVPDATYSAQNGLGTNRTSTYPTPLPIVTFEALPSSDSEDEFHRNLSRFAFKSSASNTQVDKPGVSSRSGSAVASQTLPISSSAPKVKLKRPNSHRFSDDFSDTQLASLTKCVSCNLKWTSKKTTSQKMIHIQNCASKKLLSDDTVRTLIRKEVGFSSDKNSHEGTGQTSAEEGEKTTTFLETVVNEVSCSKKGRRPHVLGTVKSLPETRGSIMGKARAVLDASVQHRDSVVRCQVSKQTQGDTSEVPCTQAFGTSMLSSRADSYSRQHLGPSQTQAFGKSALGHLQSTPGHVPLHAQISGF